MVLNIPHFNGFLFVYIPSKEEKRKREEDLSESSRKRTRLEDDDASATTIETTQSSQTAASSYGKRLLGFGYLPTSLRVDAMVRLPPQHVAPSSSSSDAIAEDSSFEFPKVSSVLCPTENDIADVTGDMPLCGELMDMLARGENDTCGVDEIVSSSPSIFVSTRNGSRTLASLGLEVGLATRTSQCDHVLYRDLVPQAFFELKGGNVPILLGTRQSAVYGSNFAMSHLKRGISRQQIIVPSYSYNGMLIQFGATVILEPSFPVYWSISKVLDMSDANDRRLALAYIRKANSWLDTLSTIQPTSSLSSVEMKLNLSFYYVKKISKLVAERGFQLFSNHGCDKLSQGVEHWSRALNLLFLDLEVRPHVAFPLAIRSPIEVDGDYIIIYDDLCKEGYSIGCPNRMKEEAVFDAYRTELSRIINLVHGAGVVHCDLYSSNIMWKKRASGGNEVDIVIIDWDCAHCLSEGQFCPNITKALSGHLPTRDAAFGTTFDKKYVDVLFIECRVSDHDDWTQLASNEKSAIDESFYRLFASTV